MAAIGPARPLLPHRPPTLIKQYWPRYSHRAIGASVLMQCTIAGLVASTLWMIGLSPSQLQFWLVIMVLSSLGGGSAVAQLWLSCGHA